MAPMSPLNSPTFFSRLRIYGLCVAHSNLEPLTSSDFLCEICEVFFEGIFSPIKNRTENNCLDISRKKNPQKNLKKNFKENYKWVNGSKFE
jgi:hypothetical protein